MIHRTAHRCAVYSKGGSVVVYYYVKGAGCWISGIQLQEFDGVSRVQLTTGTEVVCLTSELRTESPRLQNPEIWPI